jgi:hypothetical protein
MRAHKQGPLTSSEVTGFEKVEMLSTSWSGDRLQFMDIPIFLDFYWRFTGLEDVLSVSRTKRIGELLLWAC